VYKHEHPSSLCAKWAVRGGGYAKGFLLGGSFSISRRRKVESVGAVRNDTVGEECRNDTVGEECRNDTVGEECRKRHWPIPK